MLDINKVYCEDCHQTMDKMGADFVDLVITSPPYFGCRQYGAETIGREEHPLDYCKGIFDVCEKVKHVLKPTGSFYLNIGDVYFGTKGFHRSKGDQSRDFHKHYKNHKIVKSDGKYLQNKQLLLLPPRIAAMMQDSGWILRNTNIWVKSNPMPVFADDRRMPCWEYIFHFVKSDEYFFDVDQAKARDSYKDVFRTTVQPFGDHQATFPDDLIIPLIATSCPVNGLVYDPFMGSGTTAYNAIKMKRNYIGSEINPDYMKIIERRTDDATAREDII